MFLNEPQFAFRKPKRVRPRRDAELVLSRLTIVISMRRSKLPKMRLPLLPLLSRKR